MTKKVVSSPKNRAAFQRQQRIAQLIEKAKRKGEKHHARAALKRTG